MNTRGVVARIQGEPAVPRMIPGGVVSRPIPGRVVRTLGGELVFPGMIPGGVASHLLLFIAGYLFVYNRGVLIHTSDLVAASAWVACKRPSSGCDSVCAADV